jgi:hypothetical protein
MTAHPHAENMRLYAEDAAETDKPWERWESRSVHATAGDPWAQHKDHPAWHRLLQYRRKPKPLEMWANLYPNGLITTYMTKRSAIECSVPECGRIAVLMREVTE